MAAATGRWDSRWLSLCLGTSIAATLIGCGEMGEDVGTSEVTADLTSINGLQTSNGLCRTNGLQTTTLGRTQVAYLVRCALPAGASIVKRDQNGVSYTFTGL